MQHKYFPDLKIIDKCPICKKKLSAEQMKIIEEKDEGMLIYVSCGSCHSNLIFSVVKAPMGLIGQGVVTDLSENEVIKFKDVQPISQNEILEVHEKLEK